MENKVFKTLEFNKILDELAAFTDNTEVKDRIFSLCPAKSFNDAKTLLKETTEGVGVILRRGNPQSLKIKNVIPSVKKAEMGGVMSIREIISLRDLCVVVSGLKRYISDDKTLEEGTILSLGISLTTLPDLKRRIDEVVLTEDEILDTASDELYRIRKRMKSQSAKIREVLNSVISSSKYQKALQEPIITTRGDRFVVPVKAECKNEIPGIVHDSSSSGATIFIEPMQVVELTNELSELLSAEKKEIDRIIAELSAFCAQFADTIEENVKIVFELDFIFSKAKLSIKHNGVEPKLNDRGYISIKKGRHPLLPCDKVVPIDIYLGDEFDTLVITGPNTGGKTVSLKTLGLFTLMTLSGLHIGASDSSEMSFFTDVFADIGDEQSIEQSLSTFSSHIVNLVGILKKVNDKTLVLTDELGAGTDPLEGAALAVSILEYMRNHGAKVAATTHYSELKMYALSTEGVENASCEFDVRTLSPTYKLLIGVPGKSNAFAISKKLGIDDSIIEAATKHLAEDNVKLEDVLVKLEENRTRSEYQKSKADAMMRDARSMLDKAKKAEREADIKTKKQLDEARIEALRILETAKEESQKIIKELKEIKNIESVKEAIDAQNRAKDALKEQTDKIAAKGDAEKKINRKPPKNLKLGETVKILSLDKEASVLTIPDSNGNLMVLAGIMKMKVNTKDLIRIKQENEYKEQKKTSTYLSTSKTKDVKTEIDLRGMLSDEAILQVDKFIDDSLLASLKTVTIIHGKGTGALRSAITEYLRHHKSVESYRAGKYGEGEHGVTVVTLK